MAVTRLQASEGLGALLADARQDSVEFPMLLANHAPMVLVALDGLGAPESRLRDYLDLYRFANGLVPPPPAVRPIAPATWTEALGERSREADYRTYFEQALARHGMRATLARSLPALLPGIAASALHALMRLAYGLMRQDAAEVATALGYWACTHLPLPCPQASAAPITDDPAAVLARVAALPSLRDVVPETDLLWHSIRAVGWTPCFAPVVDWLRIDPASTAKLAGTALRLFAATMDFAALHALTGMHWVRLVAPFCPDPEALLRSFWQVIAALVPKLGFPAMPDEVAVQRWRQLPCPDWPEIAAAATASDDEHDISLVFSAREEEKVYADRLYRVVAARRMRLIA